MSLCNAHYWQGDVKQPQPSNFFCNATEVRGEILLLLFSSREPKYMVNPVEYEEADPEKRQYMLDEATPTAKRNILLIRHGQYVMDSSAKNHHSLTPLGNVLK